MTTTIKKSLAAVALLGALAFGATTAGAAENNLAALTAQLAALQAQIASLTGGSSCSSYTHTVTLRRGSMGSQVSAMQAVVGATADGNFGPGTEAKVKAFQMSKGLTADGVVGPNTGAAISAAGSMNCGGDDDNGDDDNGDDDNGPLSGGAGSITVDDSSEFSSEEVGEGAEDVAVLEFNVEADDESDVEITSVKIEMVESGSTSSEDLTDYAESVSIWLDGDMVGEADAEDFTENNDVWTKSISLDGAIVRAGEDMDFTVAVTALNNLDSGDIDSDAWTADVLNVRFEDGDGVVTTEDTDGDSLEKTFNFESFASATDLELMVELNGDEDAINESRVIDVDDSDDTDNVSILAFTIEADGDSDVNIDEIPVNVDVTGAANVDDMITGISLWMGDDEDEAEEISNETVGSGVGTDETYTFEDLDLDIESNKTESFWVRVDFKSTADVDLDNGDTIAAQLSATEVDAIEAEDETGEDLSTSDLVGTAVGEAHTVYDGAFAFELVSTSDVISQSADPATAGSDTTATFTLVYEITAFDESAVNIDKTCVENGDSATADEGTSYIVSDAGNNSSTCTVSSTASTATGDSDAWTVDAGDTETFTLTVAVTSSADSFAKVYLESINWESDTTTPDTSPDLFFVAGLGEDDTSTDTVFLNTI